MPVTAPAPSRDWAVVVGVEVAVGGCELAGGNRVTVGIVEPRIELVGGGGSGMGLDGDTSSDSDAIADVVAVLVEVECEGFESSEVVEAEDDVSSDGTSER